MTVQEKHEENRKRIEALDFALDFLVNRITEEQKEHFRNLQYMLFDLKEKEGEEIF